jgi:hypothetical protein
MRRPLPPWATAGAVPSEGSCRRRPEGAVPRRYLLFQRLGACARALTAARFASRLLFALASTFPAELAALRPVCFGFRAITPPFPAQPCTTCGISSRGIHKILGCTTRNYTVVLRQCQGPSKQMFAHDDARGPL